MIISKKNKAFTKFKNETKGLFLKKLMNIVEEYVEANSIQLILKKENIIIGINNLDISNNILKLLNEKINDINLK
jgi:Skp family chaperone for outer membrane proteins